MRKFFTKIMLLGAFFVGVKNFFTGEGQSQSDSQSKDDASTNRRSRLWTTAKYFAAFGLLLAIGGFLIAALGLIPIGASSGHWAITRWFLDFSKQRSVSTHSLGTDVPPLDEERFVLQGAGAYETNCRACHGSPSLPNPRVAQHLTPPPPYLPTTLHKWDDAELFYIVKNGIKFTGMPAWSAQKRDDEVWAMVAFLRRFPALDEAEYDRLANGDADPSGDAAPLKDLLGPTDVPRAIKESCSRCHGADGLGRGSGAFPKLAGQSSEYLYNSLQAYARNDRFSGVMGPLALGLSDEELRELARYYAGLEALPTVVPAGADMDAIERGRRIVLEGIPAQRIASCAACHGPDTLPRKPDYPELAGQYHEYLSLQLNLFKQDARGGTRYANIMRQIAVRLSAQQVRDVSLYYSSLSPARRDRQP